MHYRPFGSKAVSSYPTERTRVEAARVWRHAATILGGVVPHARLYRLGAFTSICLEVVLSTTERQEYVGMAHGLLLRKVEVWHFILPDGGIPCIRASVRRQRKSDYLDLDTARKQNEYECFNPTHVHAGGNKPIRFLWEGLR